MYASPRYVTIPTPPTHPPQPNPHQPKGMCVCVCTVGNVCKSKVCYHPHPHPPPHPTPPTHPNPKVYVCVCVYSWEYVCKSQGMLPSPPHPPTPPKCVCVCTVENVCKPKICYHPHPTHPPTPPQPTPTQMPCSLCPPNPCSRPHPAVILWWRRKWRHFAVASGVWCQFEEARVAPTSAIIPESSHPIQKSSSKAIVAYHLFEHWELVVAEKGLGALLRLRLQFPAVMTTMIMMRMMTVSMTATTAMTLSHFQFLMRGTFLISIYKKQYEGLQDPSTFWWTSPTTFWWWRPVSHRSWDLLFVINDWFMLRMFWRVTWFWVPYLRLAMTTWNFSSKEVVERRNNAWRKTKHSINWKILRRRSTCFQMSMTFTIRRQLLEILFYMPIFGARRAQFRGTQAHRPFSGRTVPNLGARGHKRVLDVFFENVRYTKSIFHCCFRCLFAAHHIKRTCDVETSRCPRWYWKEQRFFCKRSHLTYYRWIFSYTTQSPLFHSDLPEGTNSRALVGKPKTNKKKNIGVGVGWGIVMRVLFY